MMLLLIGVGCASRGNPSAEPAPGVETTSHGESAEEARPNDEMAEEAYWEDLLAPHEEPVEQVAPEEETTPAAHDILAEVDPETLEAERVRFVEAEPVFDYPVVTNEKVLGWIDYYANRNPETFAKGLVRSGFYLPMFRQIFREAGIPQDLVYMAHVESAYKTTAYSRARAKGIFQFISATGRRYGLRIDYWVDERSDPEKSARAATRYLKDLYEEFGDWYLALAAYNAGEGRVRRAVARTGSRDFWKLSASSRYLRRETRNYVPAILAATLISKKPSKYGFDIDYETPIAYDTVKIEGAADLRILAECAGTDFETMRLLNPALRRYQTPPSATTDVRVPVGTAEQTLVALERVPKNERVLYARHHVRPGDTLGKLARDYGVTVRAIQAANNMGRSTMIRVGRTLTIPTAAAGSYPAGTSGIASGEAVVYRVRRGDNLSRIARRHGTTASAIAAASGISLHSTLSIGQRLTVVPGVRSASQAKSIARGDGGSSGSKTYTVRRGDSLWRIATRHGTTVARLCSLNNLSPNAILRPGMRLSVR